MLPPQHPDHHAAADCGFVPPRFGKMNPCPYKTTIFDAEIVSHDVTEVHYCRTEREEIMQFSGTGTFSHEAKVNIDANLEFIWEPSKLGRKDMLEISATTNDRALISKYFTLPSFPWSLSGITKEGFKIVGSGLAIRSSGESFSEEIELSLGFRCNYLQFGNENIEFDYIDFYLPNIFIAFDEMNKVGKRSTRSTSQISLSLSDAEYTITLSELNNIVTQKKDILNEGNNLLTVRVTLRKVNGPTFFNEAQDLMDHISELISIGCGGSVGWVQSCAYKDNERVFNVFRDIDFTQLNPFRKLLPIDLPYCVTEFIKGTVNVYSGLSEHKRKALKRLRHQIHFSSERLVFPTPFSTLGSCIEDFVQYAIPETDSHYIARADRRKIDPCFAVWVKENIVVLLDEADKADFDKTGMKQKLSALLQRNLRSRISKLLDSYNISYERDWVSDFVKKRNAAAHGTYTYEKNDYLIWSRMASLLERVLLKELNFKGEFIDWAESPPISKEFN